MSHTDAYECDLAYIHDKGFGEFARESAPGLLNLFQQNGLSEGLVEVFLHGCPQDVIGPESRVGR